MDMLKYTNWNFNAQPVMPISLLRAFMFDTGVVYFFLSLSTQKNHIILIYIF